MLTQILSGDFPRSRALTAILVAIFVLLTLAPFLFPGTQPLNVSAKICYFIVLAASYDLLLGYTGIVSFAHTMFFGVGGYGVGLALFNWGTSWLAVLAGLAIALLVSVALSFVIGLVSLRVRTIFFAMITLAVASAFAIFASQLSGFTGGEDGRSFSVPALLRPSFRLFESELFGVAVTGRIVDYYLVFFVALGLFLLMIRIVNSPFGRVLQAIRENTFRAEAIGYRTVVYRTIANCLGAAMATMAGALMALWLRYIGPDTSLSFSIMIDILLMVVIGGMGTMYGAAIGATLFILAQNYLQALMGAANKSLTEFPLFDEKVGGKIIALLPKLLHPDRWLLWLGVLFILSVYFFPTGIVGKLRRK